MPAIQDGQPLGRGVDGMLGERSRYTGQPHGVEPVNSWMPQQHGRRNPGEFTRHRLTMPSVKLSARYLVLLNRRPHASTRTKGIAQHPRLLLKRPTAPARHTRDHSVATSHTTTRMTGRNALRALNNLARRPALHQNAGIVHHGVGGKTAASPRLPS